jgi:DNA-binding NarL/FixJ family response regulator
MATPPRATVLLADDHAIVRDGIAKLLADFGFEVVGTVGDGQALLEAAKRLDPDIIVTDISMPGPVNGLDAVGRLRANGCRGKIIVLTMHADATLAVEALRAGASAFVLKESSGDELLTALDRVVSGQ